VRGLRLWPGLLCLFALAFGCGVDQLVGLDAATTDGGTRDGGRRDGGGEGDGDGGDNSRTCTFLGVKGDCIAPGENALR
jgi:hypothetical protein